MCLWHFILGMLWDHFEFRCMNWAKKNEASFFHISNSALFSFFLYFCPFVLFHFMTRIISTFFFNGIASWFFWGVPWSISKKCFKGLRKKGLKFLTKIIRKASHYLKNINIGNIFHLIHFIEKHCYYSLILNICFRQNRLGVLKLKLMAVSLPPSPSLLIHI